MQSQIFHPLRIASNQILKIYYRIHMTGFFFKSFSTNFTFGHAMAIVIGNNILKKNLI